MPVVSTIDSNITGLRIAEEESIGVLPGSPVWKPLEPNSYQDFGGQIATVARNPINPSRQRKKGTTTDLDATGGLESDITQSNMQELLQGLMYADFRRKAELLANGSNIDEVETTGTDGLILNNTSLAGSPVEVDDGGTGYVVGDILTLVGGTYARPATLRVLTAPAGVVATVEVVDGGAYSVAPSSPPYTTTGGTGTGCEVDTGIFSFTEGPAVAFLVNHLVLLSGLAASSNNGLHVVTSFNAGGNVMEFSGSTLVADASPAATADVVAVGYQFASATVNVDADGTTSYPRLVRASGSFDFTTLGLNVGEMIFIGGDLSAEKFSTAANNGFARVRSVAAAYIELDKTAQPMVDETGTGKTIRIFFGRVLQNELGTDIVRRTYQIERTLGVPDTDAPSDEQAEYITGAVLNTGALKVPTADKAMFDLGFVAINSEVRTADDGLKSGTRPALVETDAFNTSSDVARIKLAEVVPNDSCPDPLFAYVEEITVNFDNNVSPNKAIGVLGAFEVTTGTFAVTASLSAYFATVEAISAVRNNVDITFDMQLVKANAGISLDLPLVTLGNGKPDVAQDTAIKIPLELEAATAAKINPASDYTAMWSFFDYLPDLAEG